MADIAKLTVLLQADVSKLRSELEKSNRSLDSFKKKVGKSVTSIKRQFQALGAGFVGVQLTKSLASAGIEMERFQNALAAATGSQEKAAQELKFIDAEAQRLGLSFQSLAGQYAQLAAATKGTNLEGGATRKIFSSVSEAARVLGLSTDNAQGAFRAITQIMSKGKVQAEELRGQLGERLPGAFQIAAKSMGVTTAELNKMLERGEVMSEDFLPAFAAELQKTFGGALPDSINSAQASFARFQNALFKLKASIAEGGFLDTLSAGAEAFAQTLRNLPLLGVALVKGLQTAAENIRFKFELAATFIKGAFDQMAIDVLNTLSGLASSANSLLDAIPFIGGSTRLDAASSTLGAYAKSFKPVDMAILEARTRHQELLLKIEGITDAMADEIIANQSLAGASNQTAAALAKLNALRKQEIEDAKQLALAKDAEKAAEKARQDIIKRGQQITQQVLTDAEKFIQIDNELANLLARNAISQETYNRALKEAQIQYTVLGKVEEARESVLESLTTKQDEYNEAIAEAKLAFDANAISGEQYANAVANAFNTLNEKTEETKKALIDVDQFAVQAARNIQDSFADFLFDPFSDGLKGMLGNLADTLRRMAAEILANAALKAALNYLSSLGGGGTQGGIAGTVGSLAGPALSALGGGAAADGARVKAGQPFLVGERGPELFIPNTQGVIEPNGAGMGSVTNVNVTVNGIRDEGGMRATANQIAGQAGSAVQRANQRNG